MALGAALATGKPQAYAVVPGPGPAQFRRRAAHRLRHERAGAGADRANSARPRSAAASATCTRSATRPASSPGWSITPRASTARAKRRAKVAAGDPRHARKAGPARPRSNAPSMSGASARRVAAIAPPAPPRAPRIDEDAVRAAAKLLGKAKRVLIVAGGGAQDASPEVTLLSSMLQAPVMSLPARPRRARRPRSVQRQRCRSGATCGARPTRCSASARGCSIRSPNGASTTNLQIVRVDADTRRAGAPAQTERGADRRCRADPAPADRRTCQASIRAAPSRRDEMQERQAKMRAAARASSRRSSPSSKRSAPNCRRTASMSTRSRRSALPRASPSRSTSRARSSRPAIRTISAGAMPPRSARSTRGPTCRCSRSTATAASSTPATSSPPPCATAFRWSPSCSPTAPSAMCAASRRSASATG